MKKILQIACLFVLVLLINSTVFANSCLNYLNKLAQQNHTIRNSYSFGTHAPIPTLNELENNLGKTQPKKLQLQSLNWNNYAALILGNDVLAISGTPPTALRQKFGIPTLGEIKAVMGKPNTTKTETVLLYKWACPENSKSTLSAYVKNNKVSKIDVTILENGAYTGHSSGSIGTLQLSPKLQQLQKKTIQQVKWVFAQAVQPHPIYENALKNCSPGKYPLGNIEKMPAGTPVLFRTIKGWQNGKCVVISSKEFPTGVPIGLPQGFKNGKTSICKYSPKTITMLLKSLKKMRHQHSLSYDSAHPTPLQQAQNEECAAN